MLHEAGALPGLPDGARAVRPPGGVHGLQAGMLHDDDQLREVRSGAGSVHGDAVRAAGGLHAGSGAGLLPRALLPALLPGVRLPDWPQR